MYDKLDTGYLVTGTLRLWFVFSLETTLSETASYCGEGASALAPVLGAARFCSLADFSSRRERGCLSLNAKNQDKSQTL